MKMVEAIVKPFKLDEVKEALTKAGDPGNDRRRSQRVSAARRATPSSIAAPNTRWIFCRRSRSKFWCLTTKRRRSLK